MLSTAALPPDLAAVLVHGPASNPLTGLLWDLGLRPVAGTTGATIWLPGPPVAPDLPA
jgi:hypothetical protein